MLNIIAKLVYHTKLHTSQTFIVSRLKVSFACLPYKITYFSNLIVLSWRCGTGLFTIQNYILLKPVSALLDRISGLFTIQNYILLKPQMSAFLYNMGLFTIQNYILLKLFGKPPQSPHTLVCHKKLHTSQTLANADNT